MQSVQSFIGELLTEGQPPAYALPEAQWDELQLVRQAFNHEAQAQRVPTPGDRVEHIHLAGSINSHARQGLVLMFWRWLDLEDWLDQDLVKRTMSDNERTMVPDPDCLICYTHNGTLSFVVAQSGFLKVIPMGPGKDPAR